MSPDPPRPAEESLERIADALEAIAEKLKPTIIRHPPKVNHH